MRDDPADAEVPSHKLLVRAGYVRRVALTLRTLAGVSTPEIARAFLTTESTMAQRLVRAKRAEPRRAGPKCPAEKVFRGRRADRTGVGKQGCGAGGKGALRGPIHALTWGVGSQSGGVVGTVAETAG